MKSVQNPAGFLPGLNGRYSKDRELVISQQETYLPKPAVPDLFQVEKTVAAQVRGLQELD